MEKFKNFKIFFLGAILLLYGLLICQKINLVTADLGRHLKNGELILNSLSVPKTNLYSYTYHDFPFLNHHWGSGVIFYLIEKIAGFTGISVFYLLISLLTLFIFFLIAKNKSKFSIAILTALLCLPVISSRFEIRPESFSYLFAGIFWLILENVRLGRSKEKWLFILPVIMFLWVNLHIYFFLGFLLIGVFILEEVVRLVKKGKLLSDLSNLSHLGATLGLSAVACLLNPVGLKGALYPLQIFGNYGYRLFENQSVWFLRNIVAYPPNLYFEIAFGLLVVSFIYCLIKKRSISVTNLVLSLLFSYLGWTAVRNFTLFGLFVLPVVADNFSGLFKRELKNSLEAVIFLNVGFLLAGAVVLINLPFWQGREDAGFGLKEGSSSAAEFFKKENLAGPIFNNYDVGGYLIYYLYPQEKVFVDNRPEAYPRDFFEKTYIPMQEDEEKWKEKDKRYNFNVIFFYRHDLTPWGQAFLISRISDPSWVPVFVDDYSIIFLKRNRLNEGLIKKFELPKEIFSAKK